MKNLIFMKYAAKETQTFCKTADKNAMKKHHSKFTDKTLNDIQLITKYFNERLYN